VTLIPFSAVCATSNATAAQATTSTASTATNLGNGTTTANKTGTSVAAIAHSQNSGAFAAVGAAAAFIAMECRLMHSLVTSLPFNNVKVEVHVGDWTLLFFRREEVNFVVYDLY
jgi:hypothetical protein